MGVIPRREGRSGIIVDGSVLVDGVYWRTDGHMDNNKTIGYTQGEGDASTLPSSAPPQEGGQLTPALFKTLANMAGLEHVLQMWSNENGVPVEVLAEVLTHEDTLDKLRNLAKARVIANIGQVLTATEEFAMMPNNSADRKLLLGIAGFTTSNMKVESNAQPITMVEIRMDEGLRKYEPGDDNATEES